MILKKLLHILQIILLALEINHIIFCFDIARQ
jgi:hypothetical protein